MQRHTPNDATQCHQHSHQCHLFMLFTGRTYQRNPKPMGPPTAHTMPRTISGRKGPPRSPGMRQGKPKKDTLNNKIFKIQNKGDRMSSVQLMGRKPFHMATWWAGNRNFTSPTFVCTSISFDTPLAPLEDSRRAVAPGYWSARKAARFGRSSKGGGLDLDLKYWWRPRGASLRANRPGDDGRWGNQDQ